MGGKLRAGLALIGLAGVYALLAAQLPEVAPSPSSSTASAVVEAPSPTELAGGHEHPKGGHSCKLEAKGMYAKFQAAIAHRGKTHQVAQWSGLEVVAGQVTVGLRADADLAAVARQHGLRVVRAPRGRGPALLKLAPATSLADTLAGLRKDPAVRYAEPNLVAHVALTPNDPFLPLSAQRKGGLESAWDVTTGAPAIVVAVLDTGVDPNHPDLTNRLVPGYDVVNNTNVMTDDNGHGTAMTGIIVAEGQNNEGLAGVAFNARVMPIKVADANGQASVADVVAGIDRAIQANVRVINLSLGAPVGSQALRDAINRALAAGIVVVAAAGNDPVNHEVFPAAYPGVISATAMGERGLGFDAVLASGVEVGAPGESLVTTLPGDVYGFVSGSSAAAAFTSGVAALVASANPALTGAQIGEVLKESQDEVPALKPFPTLYRFGLLNAGRAVRRNAAGFTDIAVTDVRVYPASPQPGTQAAVVVEVSNQGNVPTPTTILKVDRVLAGNGQRIELGVAAVQPLALGERHEYRLTFTVPVAGRYNVRGILNNLTGETETVDNVRQVQMTVSAAAKADLRIVDRTITDPVATAGTVTATVTVENRGTAAAQNVTVSGDVTPAGSRLPAVAAAAPAGAALAAQVIPTLAVGQRAQVQLTWTIPNPAPTAIQRLRVAAAPLTGETEVYDNQAFLDFEVGSAATLRGLYQQSNGVDIIPDAPWRVDPNRGYVPVQVFFPSKGGRTTSTKLRVDRTTVRIGDNPGTPGAVVYDDPHGAAPTTPSGLAIADEMGHVRSSNLDLFQEQDLDMNGRHEILRIPRAVFGVAAAPTSPVDKYVDVKVDWEQQRILLWVFSTTRSGSHRAVLKVLFSSSGFPSLPGDNHYHDVHHHTIAEWFFGSALDIFAPRKAYGGPLQMVFECAYAMGIIPSADAAGARDRIITSDHNCFNNRTIPDPDGTDHRPPFGPQSPTAQPGLTQLEAYRNIFGITAGEEIAFKQDVPLPRIPFLNNILNQLPGIPIGAHMLLYRADHVEGAWHGGGWLKGPGNPNINVDLFPLLNHVAKNDQARQSESFAYAAHPFSGQGWNDQNLDQGFGLDPQYRTKDAIHDATNKFVLKGLEWFNGRGTRKLPSAQIDWNDLNPWTDPDFQRGSATWDKGLWDGVTLWHQAIARDLTYSFVSDPELVFIRKIYQAGGSDAHGDFNFSTGRAATPLNVQSTYNVGDEAWYKVRTYCLGDGKAGATSEERWLAAYRDGNSIVTDGPLVSFALDADGKFDAGDLRWHDQTSVWEDADGKIGGDGALDGGYTALVRRGSDAPRFRYRYSSSDEFGPIASILLYKTEAGNPNPSRTRASGFAGLSSYEQITGVNQFPLSGANADHDQALDPAREGPVTKNTAWALGAYTVGDPDQADLGVDCHRAWTNPIYAVPYDADAVVNTVDTTAGVIPPGGLTLTLTFDVSMNPQPAAVEVKALDANGDSTGKVDAPDARMGATTGSGWSDRTGIKQSVLTLTNTDPVPLGGDEYPAGSGKVTLVIYTRDRLQDAAGNALNPIAVTVTAQQVPGGPLPGQGLPGGSSTAPTTSTTAPGSTGTPATAASGGGGSGGGACALAPTPGSSTPAAPGLLLALGLLGLLVLRRRD